MINVALPVIMAEFGVRLAVVEWVVLVYLVTITASLLLWGRMGDRFGPGRVYLAGMLVFACAAAACGLAPGLGQLILFRFVQALGAAMMMANGPAIIRLAFPVDRLGRMLGAIGIVTSLGLMSGPLVSGYLIHWFSWRAIFFATLPVSLSALLLGRLFLWPTLKPRQNIVAPLSSCDWPGLLLWGLLVTLLAATVSLDSLTGSARLVMGVAGAVVLLGFLLREQRAAIPLLPLDLVACSRYGLPLLAAVLSFAVLFVVLLLTPFYLHHVLALDSRGIGRVMMAVPAAVFVVAPLAGRLHDRVGPRLPTVSGLLLSSAVLSWLAINGPGDQPALTLALVLLGCGQALFLSPNSASVLGKAAADQGGIMSGLLATSRNLGMMIGTALAGVLFSSLFTHLSGGQDLLAYGPDLLSSFLLALRLTVGCAALLALLGAVILFLPRRG